MLTRIVMLLFILAFFFGVRANAQTAPIMCCPKCPDAKVVTKWKTKTVNKVQIVKEVETVKEHRHHNINLLLGTGPRYVEVVPNEARLKRNVVGGIQYHYTTESGFNLGGQILSNDTYLGLVGIQF